MQEILTTLVSFFLIEPIQVELAERLSTARAPEAVIAELKTCAAAAAPAIVTRAASDPWWAASNAARLWIGSERPDALLLEVAPGCEAALIAARPLLAP